VFSEEPKKRPKFDLWPSVEFCQTDYFLALHWGQCAQSVLASAQQAMPQAGLLAQHLLQAQPAANAATHRASPNVLMIFIGVFCLYVSKPLNRRNHPARRKWI